MYSIKYVIPIFVFLLVLGEMTYSYFSSAKTLSLSIEKKHIDFMQKSMLTYQESIEYFLRKNNMGKIREDITSLGFDKQLIEIILVNDKKLVEVSIDLTYVGETLKDELEHNKNVSKKHIDFILSTVFSADKKKKRIIWNDVENQKLIGVYTINYGISKTNSYRNREGAFIIIRDTSDIPIEVKKELRSQLFPSMIFILFISILFSLVLHFYISRRINRLDMQSRLYSDGDSDVDFTVYGNDEISKLGITFNTMIKSIEEQNILITEKEKHLSLMLDSIGDAVIATDGLGIITRINPTALKLTGWSYSDAIGANIVDVFNIYVTNSKVSVKKILETCIEPKLPGHTILKSKDEIEYQISDSSAPIIDEGGKTIGVILVFRDVTEEHNIQEELYKYRDDLESLVSSRTKELEDSISDLNRAQNQLVESEKMVSLGSLVAGIAHEINTPVGLSLTGITHIEEITTVLIKDLENQTLKQSSLTNFLKDVKVMSNSMQNSLLDAAQLIKSFKQISVDQHAEQMREFNLYSYVNDVLYSLKNEIKNTHINITNNVDVELNLNSYPGVFSQLLTNLIINSKIHAFNEDEDGAIEINAKKENANLLLTYEDNGSGMSQKVVKHIFDPFFTTKMGQGGSGLGMHIVYNLVTQKMNGTIKCQSSLGHGTKFIINIPIEE